MKDTSPEIEAIVERRLLALSGEERVIMASRSFDAAKEIILASFPPGLSEIEIKVRLCERLYGDEVDLKGFEKYLRERERQNGESQASE
ncbi:MAG TPA: hypothetical protein VI756_12160 [Blastocatellia bacterium]